MLDKDPQAYSVMTYLAVFFFSAWGGAVSYSEKLDKGLIAGFNWGKFLCSMATSAFSGFVVFYMCQATDFLIDYTAPLVGIAGHMGGMLLALFEVRVIAKIKGKEDESN